MVSWTRATGLLQPSFGFAALPLNIDEQQQALHQSPGLCPRPHCSQGSLRGSWEPPRLGPSRLRADWEKNQTPHPALPMWAPGSPASWPPLLCLTALTQTSSGSSHTRLLVSVCRGLRTPFPISAWQNLIHLPLDSHFTSTRKPSQDARETAHPAWASSPPWPADPEPREGTGLGRSTGPGREGRIIWYPQKLPRSPPPPHSCGQPYPGYVQSTECSG